MAEIEELEPFVAAVVVVVVVVMVVVVDVGVSDYVEFVVVVAIEMIAVCYHLYFFVMHFV